MNNDSNNKEEQKIEAGQNTAHVAGRAASRYFGGKLGGAAYDKLAQTRLGQRLERGVGKTLAKTPGIGDVNKAVNDTGAVNAANKAIDTLDGKKGNNTNQQLKNKANANNTSQPKNASADQTLQKNKANKKNNFSFLNRRSNSSASESEENSTEENESESKGVGSDDVLSISTLKKIKIILILAPLVLMLFIFLFFIVAIIAIINPSLFASTNQNMASYGTDNFTPVNEPGTKAYKNEIAYYEKLEEISKKYFDKCGVVLDKYYIHNTLIYRYGNPENFYVEQEITEDSNKESEEVDYKDLAGKIETIADMMINTSTCYVDYNVDGEFYNKLKESSFFKEYYKEMLKEHNNDADFILEDIFYISASFTNRLDSNSKALYVSPDLAVNVSASNFGDTYDTVNLKDYIAGSVYADINTELISNTNIQLLKAHVVQKTTSILDEGNYSIDDTHIDIVNNSDNTLYCDLDEGCSKESRSGYYILNTGGSGDSDAGDVKVNDLYYYKPPLDDTSKTLLVNVVSETFGDVLTDDGGIANIDSNVELSGTSNYKTILANAYDGYTVSNIAEDNYTADVVYTNNIVKVDAVFYDQNDYADVYFCGRTANTRRPGTIKSSGCGVVAMSIVASTFIDKSYDPIRLMNDAYKWGYCGISISGTSSAFFKKEANNLKINYQYVSKNGNLNRITDSLASGKSLVIALMGPKTFTSGGHYIVLGGINGNTEEVYVYDPNHKSNANNKNRNSGNGWYSFNDVIVKEARAFYVLTKGN